MTIQEKEQKIIKTIGTEQWDNLQRLAASQDISDEDMKEYELAETIAFSLVDCPTLKRYMQGVLIMCPICY